MLHKLWQLNIGSEMLAITINHDAVSTDPPGMQSHFCPKPNFSADL